jgi:hypothetical protein
VKREPDRIPPPFPSQGWATCAPCLTLNRPKFSPIRLGEPGGEPEFRVPADQVTAKATAALSRVFTDFWTFFPEIRIAAPRLEPDGFADVSVATSRLGNLRTLLPFRLPSSSRRKPGSNFRTKCPEMPPPGGDGRRLDKSIPATPVVAAPREQPHRIAVAPHLQPVAVVLDLVHPVGPSGRLRGARGNAGLDEPTGTDDRSGAAADQPRDMVQAKL